MRRSFSWIMFVFAFFVVCAFAEAATTKDQGAIIVRVPDGTTPVCINANKHKLSFILRKIIINKDVGYFKQDKEVGLLLNVFMAGNTGDGGDGQENQKFPRMFKTSIEEFDQGLITLPFEKVLFHGYKLKSDNTLTTQIETSFSVLKKKEKAPFAVAIEQLGKITSSLPIPPNPYVPAFRHFANYADEVVTKSINEENNVSEELKGGNIAFAFSENDTCDGTLETTGTIAVVKSSVGTEDEGIINTSKNYCYTAQFKPVFELRFASMPAGGNCTTATNFKQLRNPYLGFVLNASSVTVSLPPFIAFIRTDSLADRDAKKRCEIHGLLLKDCM